MQDGVHDSRQKGRAERPPAAVVIMVNGSSAAVTGERHVRARNEEALGRIDQSGSPEVGG